MVRALTPTGPPRRRLLVAGLLLAGGATAAGDGAPWPAGTPVRFAPELDYGPFVYAEPDGRIAGLSVDLLRLIERQSGLVLRWLPARPLAEQLALARRGEVDLLSSLRPTPERSAYLSFTTPYAKVPALLIVRAGTAPPNPRAFNPLKAYDGLVVAVGAGYAVEPFVRRVHPLVRWEAVPDDAAALQGVHEGRYAAAVVDQASAAFVMRRRPLPGLASAGEIGFTYELAFAVRKDAPALLAAVEGALRGIPAAERRALQERWLSLPAPTAAEGRDGPRPVVGIGLSLLGLAAVTSPWLWRRARAGGAVP